MMTRNHLKMGRLIQDEMAKHDMPLNKPLFLAGNLAPDLIVSYLFRQHSYPLCANQLKKLIRRLYDGGAARGYMKFSFLLGIMSHYLCDFFCYPHTTVFSGGVREHARYEKYQTVSADDILPFEKQNSTNVSFSTLVGALDGHITEHEQVLADNIGVSTLDIPQAVYFTTWAASAIYLNAAAKGLDVGNPANGHVEVFPADVAGQPN